MKVLSRRCEDSESPLGQCRGILDLARIDLNLTRAREASGSAAPGEDYPSPPMSGSPPNPPKQFQEAGDRSQGSYQVSSLAIFRGPVTTQGDVRSQTSGPGAARSAAPIASERPAYSFPVPESAIPRPMQYLPPQAPMLPQHGYLGPSQLQQASYPSPTGALAADVGGQASPKVQRKSKGHVASACVPCKRAHLRCDAQRPCSRCLSTGKEEACVDVQHKKRGRPRLRDDREAARFEPSRFAPASEQALRRPMSVYGGAPASPVTYDDGLRRSHSYRVLKSHPTEPVAARYMERASAADANIVYPAQPPPISTRNLEPAAYLTMDLEVAKASTSFADAIGRPSLRGLRLMDVLIPNDREKAFGQQRQMQDEQKRRDPSYLPPIFSKQEEERVLQGLGFSAEELARFPLSRQEYLTFTAQDGQPRTFAVRMGLAKQESIYFVVVALNLAATMYAQPSPSSQTRESAYAFPSPVQYGQPTPLPGTYDPRQARVPESAYPSRQPGPPVQAMPSMATGPGPSYAASQSRPEYAVGPAMYETPRSELGPSTMVTQAPGYQLPPIRSQAQDPPPRPPSQDAARSTPKGDDRQRVDIGGLLEKPDQPEGRQQ